MVTIEKTGPGNVTYRALGEQVSPGDRIDVSEAAATYYCDERNEFERVEGDSDADSAEDSDSDEAGGDDPSALEGVGEAKADTLREAGYETTADLADASAEELAAIDGISDDLAASVHEQTGA